MKTINLPIQSINDSIAIPCRQGLHEDVLQSYIQAFSHSLNKWKFPPLSVAMIEGVTYLLDGQHRLHAASTVGLEEVPCEINENIKTVEQARKVALCANVNHGEKLSREELKANIKEYIECTHAPNSIVARTFNVSHAYVLSLKEEMSGATEVENKAERVREVHANNPTASMRQIAKESGVDRRTVKRILASPQVPQRKGVYTDCNGTEIPQDNTDKYLALKSAMEDLKDVVTMLKGRIDSVISMNAVSHPGDVQTALAIIKQLNALVKDYTPDAVCTCRGDGCTRCHGVGFLSKKYFELFIPVEERELIMGTK